MRPGAVEGGGWAIGASVAGPKAGVLGMRANGAEVVVVGGDDIVAPAEEGMSSGSELGSGRALVVVVASLLGSVAAPATLMLGIGSAIFC